MKIPTLYERLRLTAHIEQLIQQVGRQEALNMIERIVEKELAREKQDHIDSDHSGIA